MFRYSSVCTVLVKTSRYYSSTKGFLEVVSESLSRMSLEKWITKTFLSPLRPMIS